MRTRKTNIHRRWLLAGMVLAMAGVARAGRVEFLAESNEVFVDVPFMVAVDVVSLRDEHTPPIFPKMTNADVADAGVKQSNNTSVSIVNGRRRATRQNTYRYLYRITPRAEGSLRIPAIAVEVDGQKLSTRPAVLRVLKTETNDLLFVEIKASEREVYVGEPLDLSLHIWIREFSQGGRSLDYNAMWQAIDKESSNFGPFADLLAGRQPKVTWTRDRRADRNGEMHTYYVYELKQRVWPERPGAIPGSDVRVIANYPLRVGRRRGMFDFFDGPRVAKSRPVTMPATMPELTVLPIPQEGRPPYYSGAVGPHELKVTAAPLELSVGDPITLNLSVRGTGRLELLKAPRLAQLPEITERFQVADDPLPGVVENGVKRFTQSLRPLSDSVTEIPAIPFAYFDTDRGEFVITRSEPIPLTVKPSEKMSATQIVQAVTPGGGTVDSLTQLGRGIEENRTDPQLLLARQGVRTSPVLAAVVAGCPLVYFASALLIRRRARIQGNRGLRRRKAAKTIAQNRLAGPDATPVKLAEAVLGYIADRSDLPAGGLTRQEAIEHLHRMAIDAATVAEVDAFLADCELAAFGGDATGGASRSRAEAALAALMRAGV
jgi:hypothetical protein